MIRTHKMSKPVSGLCISGFMLIELLMAVSIATILILALSGLIGQALHTRDILHEKNEITRQAGFALQRMTQAVGHSRLLLLPLNDIPASNWLENVREETVPPTTPTDDSVLYTAVLAVTLPLYSDLDANGVPDADDDADGRVDEDLLSDAHNDYAAGIVGIDDNGNGYKDDITYFLSDDESLAYDDDPINGIDDDNNNNIDENPPDDMNADGCPGICGVDDDGDGVVDEGSANDDDEDGTAGDDWYNPVVFYLDNGTLMERIPVPWDETGNGGVTGWDFVTNPIAENVTRFRIERLPLNAGRDVVVDITLQMTSQISGESVSLNTQIRVGGAL